jgi:alpha-tubulin suppressor-like RCC1 family protein
MKNDYAIAGEAEHSLAILEDGTVIAWGNNNLGQLGDGTFEK